MKVKSRDELVQELIASMKNDASQNGSFFNEVATPGAAPTPVDSSDIDH